MTSGNDHLSPPASSLGTVRHEGGGWAEWLNNASSEADVARDGEEVVSEGGTCLLDLVAAVDYLRRGLRPRITVWDALEEALRWHAAEHVARTRAAPAPDTDDLDPDDPDPLRTQLRRLLEVLDELDGMQMDEAIQRAVRRWSTTMSSFYNAGHWWPHPTARRHFPPVIL